MATSSRKRTHSHRSKTLEVVEKDEIEKQSKLVLKARQSVTENSVSVLRGCLEVPEEAEVVEGLLLTAQLMIPQEWGELQGLMKLLWTKHDTNPVICSVLLNLMMKMVQQSAMSQRTTSTLSADFLNFAIAIFNNDSKEVQSLILKLWLEIGNLFPSEMKTKCIDKAISVIYDSNHMLRMECLNLIGSLNHIAISQESLLSLVVQFSSDTDPRVRRASIHSLLLLLEKGAPVDLHVYQKSCELLQDDDDIVRRNALQLIFYLGIKLQTNNIQVPLAQDPNVKLSIEDDAFIKTCDMVTDQSVAVRSLATTLLGQFKGVSEKFLFQTLHKKLMSHLKVVKSEHERARDVAGGSSRDWDTGQRWGGSSTGGAPKLDLDPTEVTLLRSGSCGAFVHSLEDEFLEVRSAAIVSMGELCLINPVFGSMSLDYLVDMFNDEIESVRLLAINCLRKVSTTIHFREDQLETVLGVLQESSQEIREALHDLLATCHITTTSGLRMTVNSLLENLKKYSIDCQSIWSCMKSLGNKHTHLVCSLVPELLSSHPFFLTKEPDINDPAYVSILILVFNATGSSPTMISLFPPHVFHHYTYLHDTLPSLIPLVKVLTPSMTCQLPSLTTSSPDVFLKQILLQVDKPCQESHDSNVAIVTLKQCIKDLNQFSQVEPSLSGCVLFSSQLLQCRLSLMKVQKAISCVVMVGGSSNDIAIDIREIFLLSYRLQWAYVGHEPLMLMNLRLLRVITHCALLALTIKLDWPSDHREKFEELRLNLVARVEGMIKFCCDSNLSEPVLLQPLLSRLSHGHDQLLSLLQSTISGYLHQNTAATRLDSVKLINIKQCQAEITHPNPTDDVTHKFLSSLALALPFRAVVDNLPEKSSLAVKIKLPDGKYIVSVPKDTEIRPSIESTNGNHTQQINMKLILSHGNWTDSSSLRIQLVRYYNPDISTDAKYLDVLNELSCQAGASRIPAMDCASDCVGEVVISNSIRVRTHPQEMMVKAFNVFGPI